MSTSLYDDTVETISIDELQIFLLLFADDTVLFSYTPQGLQTLWNQLYAYCLKWNVHVNINKTVILIFKKGCRMETVDNYSNNERLKIVGKFTYLGVTLSANGWLVSYFGFNGPLRQYFSLYRAVSQRERERIDESKMSKQPPRHLLQVQ